MADRPETPSTATLAAADPKAGRGLARGIELALLFFAGPTLFAFYARPQMLFPAIWILAALALTELLFDQTFDRTRLWHPARARAALRPIFLRFLICAPLLALALWLYEPACLLQLPLRNPGLWAIIMVAYPVLSVYPQEVAFRAFFLHRYVGLFRSPRALIAANAAAFAFAHVVMHNWWSVGFSLIGGIFFSISYLRSRSLLAACIEHALYGCFLFTIGWGSYFYAGSAFR